MGVWLHSLKEDMQLTCIFGTNEYDDAFFYLELKIFNFIVISEKTFRMVLRYWEILGEQQ